jgi:hypothetical protein
MKKYCSLILVTFFFYNLNAQTSTGEKPYSFSNGFKYEKESVVGIETYSTPVLKDSDIFKNRKRRLNIAT